MQYEFYLSTKYPTEFCTIRMNPTVLPARQATSLVPWEALDVWRLAKPPLIAIKMHNKQIVLRVDDNLYINHALCVG